MSSQELIDIDIENPYIPEKKFESEIPKKKTKNTLILPKLAEENKRINFENMRMLKRILNQPISSAVSSKQHI
jgi:hypothetical protein